MKTPGQRHRNIFKQNHRRKFPQCKDMPIIDIRGIQNTKQRGPEKKLLMVQNNQNTKGIEQRKDNKLQVKKDLMETIKPKKVWTYVLQTQRPQLPAQTTIPSKNINQN